MFLRLCFEAFSYCQVSAQVLGVLFALLIFLQRKKRAYANMLWNVRNFYFLAGFLLISLMYFGLYTWVSTPSALLLTTEIILAFLIYISLSFSATLIFLLMPAKILDKIFPEK